MRHQGKRLGRILIDGEMSKRFSSGFIAIEKAVSAHPKPARMIDQERANIHAAQTIWLAQLMFEYLGPVTVIPIQPILRPKP